MFRNQKVIDLARLVDVNFDKCPCLRKPQVSQFTTFIHEYGLELEV